MSQTQSISNFHVSMMPFCDDYNCNCPPCCCTFTPNNNTYWDSMVSPVATASSTLPGNVDNMTCGCSHMPPLHTSTPDLSSSTTAQEDFRPYNPFEVKHRRRTSRAQYKVLEKTFQENPKPNAAVRRWLAHKLTMTPRGVQVWFQNRRAKAKAVQRRHQQEQADMRSSLADSSAHPCPTAATPETQPSVVSGGFSPVDLQAKFVGDATLTFALQRQYSNSSSSSTDDEVLKTPTTSPHASSSFYLDAIVAQTEAFQQFLSTNETKAALGLWDADTTWNTSPVWPSPDELALLEHLGQNDLGTAPATCNDLLDPLTHPTQSLPAVPPQQLSTVSNTRRSDDNYWTSYEALQMSSQPIFDLVYYNYTTA